MIHKMAALANGQQSEASWNCIAYCQKGRYRRKVCEKSSIARMIKSDQGAGNPYPATAAPPSTTAAPPHEKAVFCELPAVNEGSMSSKMFFSV